MGDDEYPPGLLDLEDPPALYAIGVIDLAPGVAVVGTRRCTRYGRELARMFGAAIGYAGWVTVSGMALGVDTAAHIGALDAGAPTHAVLGSGVDVCYPRQNQKVYQRLSAAGAVLSEYPPGTTPERWRFPARNRIIAAMSAAVVVVEAGERGGALITARLAAEIGRPVFALPGDIDRPASVGCNRLLKDGAHPVLGPEDLIAELSLVVGPPLERSRATDTGLPEAGLSVDELPALWGVSTAQALARLGRLEIEGAVRREGEMVYPAFTADSYDRPGMTPE